MQELETGIGGQREIKSNFRRFRRPVSAALLALYGGFVIVQTIRTDGLDKNYADAIGGAGFGLAVETGAASIAFPNRRRAIISGGLEKTAASLEPLADKIAVGMNRLIDKYLSPKDNDDSEKPMSPAFDRSLYFGDLSDSPVDNLQSTLPMVELQESESFCLPQPELHQSQRLS